MEVFLEKCSINILVMQAETMSIDIPFFSTACHTMQSAGVDYVSLGTRNDENL